MFLAQERLEALIEGLRTGFFDAQGLRNRRGDQRRVDDGGELDEADAVGKASSTSAATCTLKRVLPTPPGPVSVTRRTSARRTSVAIMVRSCSRPKSGVSWAGRFWYW